jgi:urease alpha subunit
MHLSPQERDKLRVYVAAFWPSWYQVWADGEPLTREPTKVLPMAQSHFLF